jgi:hypothetical protein
MGRKGNVNLVLPKNSGDLSFFESSISILFKNGGQMDSDNFYERIETILAQKEVGIDPTSIIHKTVLPRYFGLIFFDKPNSLYSLTNFGFDYAQSKSRQKKIDIIFDVLSTSSFGRNNNGVNSDSNVEPPLVFLKMLINKKSISIFHFGCVLFYLEVLGLSFEESLKKVSDIKNEKDEKKTIKDQGGGKCLKIIKKSKTRGFYELEENVLKEYDDDINSFIINNSVTKDYISDNIIRTNFLEQKNLSVLLRNVIDQFKSHKQLKDPDHFLHVPKEKKNSTRSVSLKKVTTKINKKSNSFSEKERFDLGWYGERYIYNLLEKEFLPLIEDLKLQINENILEIIWFNKGFDDEKNWIDKSIGKGCDILIKTNLRELNLEIKNSFDNISFFTATTNELRSMNENRQDYFLIKINKFKNLLSAYKNPPEIRTIQDPIKILNNINHVKSVTLYV